MSMEAMQNFVDKLKQKEEERRERRAIANSIPVKTRRLERCKAAYKLGAMKELLARLYNKSLPLDDDYCDSNCEINKARMCDMIDKRGGMQYITDACRKSPALQKMMTAVEKACDKKFLKKELKISDVDPADLDYHFNADEEKGVLDKIESDSDFDSISAVIKQNVENDAVKEIEKAKKEDEETEDLEQKLQDSEEVDSEEKFESAMSTYYFSRPRIYEPSLFEAIMMSRVQTYGESVTDEEIDQCFVEAVLEYTGLNVFKALKMESFDKDRVKDLADQYLAG